MQTFQITNYIYFDKTSPKAHKLNIEKGRYSDIPDISRQNGICTVCSTISVENESKKEGKYQESIQPSTTPDPGYQWESDNVTNIHYKREPRGQPFPSR